MTSRNTGGSNKRAHRNDKSNNNDMASNAAASSEARDPRLPSKWYSNYVLVILILVYIFNFIDRQILSILNEAIKADLGLTDAQMGFLYGTSFAVFYAIFGIPLAKLADSWKRTNLIALGLGTWSLMTVLSGTARSFASLGGFRIGVAIGESSATPAAFSMLSDMFSKSMRATVMAIYSSGIYIGAGIGIVIGGTVVDGWDNAYADASAPFGLVGWQAAFIIVGLPGLLLAPVVWFLREPIRGIMDGHEVPAHPAPFKDFGLSLSTIIPGLTWWRLGQNNDGNRAVIENIIMLAACVVVFTAIAYFSGHHAQWGAFGVGAYCAFSWLQITAKEDPVTFAVLFTSKAYVAGMFAFASMSFVTYSVGYWGTPYVLRTFDVTTAEAGTTLGWLAAIGGCIGVIAGGVLSDMCRARWAAGRLYMCMCSSLLALPCALIFFSTDDLQVAYGFNFLFQILSPMWIGAGASTISDLCLPKMRALGTAFYLLTLTFIGLALGPYTIGSLSDMFLTGGASPSEALKSAGIIASCMFLVSVALLFYTSKHLAKDESSLNERAMAAESAS